LDDQNTTPSRHLYQTGKRTVPIQKTWLGLFKKRVRLEIETRRKERSSNTGRLALTRGDEDKTGTKGWESELET